MKRTRKVTATKKPVRKVLKAGMKNVSTLKERSKRRAGAAKPFDLKIIPIVVQTLTQLEKELNKQEKERTLLIEKLETKLKRAQAQQEKASTQLNTVQQKAEGKNISSSKLRPLQKALDIAQSESSALETEAFKAKSELISLQHELGVVTKIKEAVSKLDIEVKGSNVKEFSKGKNKRGKTAIQLDETKPENKTKEQSSKEISKEEPVNAEDNEE